MSTCNERKNRPNILFILTDDQRFDTVAALGNPHIHTPNFDRLVQEGFAFYRNFCTTPICTPARAEILTGCTSFANHVPWFGMPINPKLTLMPRAFQDAKYHTIHVGKWHNDGHPDNKGYDYVRCVHTDNLNNVTTHGHYQRFQTPEGEIAGHSTELYTDAAIDAIEKAPTDKPWFCYLAYLAPHDPHDSPEPFASMYDPGNIPLLPNHMPEHPFDNGTMVIRDELLENWPREEAAMRRYRARYYGMISHLDHHVGRLLGMLTARGQLDNTVIVFTGDQGLAIGSHGLLGKENMYDHSIASPLIFRGPDIRAGGKSTAMSHHVDIFPTLCDLAGISRPASVKGGYSLRPIFDGQKERVRTEVLCEFYSPEEPSSELRHCQRAIRTEEWKLCWYPLIERYTLFDLINDPYELTDLLVPWRSRRRLALESGQQVWVKDSWAARDVRPLYTDLKIRNITNDLYKRMIAQMEINDDPLLTQNKPLPPLGEMSTKGDKTAMENG
ncbi:MAG: sulfatase-like hydrolase/transferase [Victivallaceae bacterium]|nr:sulfatase-like hydrolase/transferase [Victivallaceae bacterium]